MATESAINGNYAPHQGYGSLDQNHSAYASATSNPAYSNVAPPTTAAAATTQSNASSASDIPKDEVGWYFVEQYYTTLSRSPEKLFLFYNKRSQYVSGNETEKVAVSVGQRAINDRIKELEFQDCKVRVTNVDSQASDQNIVIQVIGEISNKSAPHKKFTQTFVLAGQTNGYFVLNDIFRYIVEEEDEVNAADDVQQEPAEELPSADLEEAAPATAPAAETAEPQTLTSSDDPAAVEQDAEKVDKELHEKVIDQQPSVPEADLAEAPVNGTANEEAAEAEAPAPAEAETAEETPAAASEPTATEPLEPEKPKDPEPTPAASPPKQAPVQPAAPSTQAAPAAPSKPAAPKTWANLAAAAHRVATPAVPVAQPSSTSATAAQPKAAAVPAQTAQTAPSASSGAAAREPSPAASQRDEWTSVGGDHKRQQSKAQTGAGAQEASSTRAYIKNVNDTIDAKELRSVLEKFGEIVYFDVARQKNCAFVDFKTEAGYKAAVEANPHEIGNERVVVEERRPKPGFQNPSRGGSVRGGRGSSNSGNGRGSFQGGRGGFPQRGRGGNAARGRGGAQAA